MNIFLGWVYYILYQLISLVGTIIGYFLLIPFCIFKSWEIRPGRSSIFPNRIAYQWKYKFLFPWSNEENGIQGGIIGPMNSLSVYKWSALRNPVNNLRFILPGASFLTKKKEHSYYTTDTMSTTYTLTITNGWRQCIVFFYKGTPKLRIGWLLHPSDGDDWRSWPVFQINPGQVI